MLHPLHIHTQTYLRQSPKPMIIGGENVAARSGQVYPAINPSDGSRLVEIFAAGQEEVDQAVAAAQAALHGEWAEMTPARRERLLRHLGDLIEANSQELAELESLENGKPIHYTETIDALSAAEEVYHFAGWPSKIAGETLPVSIPGNFVYTRREPLGVVAIIIPWNYPIIDALQKSTPALACGNTVILKPDIRASLVVLRLGELFIQAGFPPGVFNVLTGPNAEIVEALSLHPGVNKVLYAGPDKLGQQVIRNSAFDLKRVGLELGNKAPNCIFADADLDIAIPNVFTAAFGNTGQSCVAGSRIFVQEEVYAAVVDGLCKLAGQARLGHALNPFTEMGPMIDQAHFETVMEYIRCGKSAGGKLLAGGERAQGKDLPEGGYYLPPTLFEALADNAELSCEEVFGPLAVVFSFKTEQELVERANNTRFGMAAGVWTRDMKRAHHLAAALRVGVVWINTYNLFDAGVPFGGFKMSGYGRDNGHYSIDSLTEVKSVWIAVK